MKAIIFGANGQDGFYLCQVLRAHGIETIGTSRSGDWRRVNVADFAHVEVLFREALPDYVFHLAANSTTRHDALFENHETISTGALNVLEAARRFVPQAKVFLSGSGLQFKNEGHSIAEEDPFEASSPYSIARIQSVYAARYYRGLGVRAYVGYLFHHDSPRRGPKHVSQLVAQAARRIASGSDETLELGDISVEKEWTFAGDVARGMLTLISQEQVFEANIGSGEGYSITEWLEACFGAIGRPWREHIRLRDGFRAEYPRLVSNPARIQSLGWKPTVGFEALASMMVAG